MIEKRIAWTAVAALVAAGSFGLHDALAKDKASQLAPRIAPLRFAAVLAPQRDGDLPVVRMRRGTRTTLPYEGVTRVVPADDDVARGSFEGGKAVIEGVTTGVTTIEIYQGENKRQLLAVQVDDAATAAANSVAPDATLNTAPVAGTVVTPIAPATGAASGQPVVVAPNTPVVVAAGDPNPASAALPQPNDATPTVPGRSGLAVSLRYAPAPDNPSQSIFTITYNNHSTAPATGVVIRSALDDVVSYVTGSATNGGRYDSAARELVWNIGTVEAGASGKTVSFRVTPVETGAVTFYSVATIEDASGLSITSNALKVGTSATPLLTVFALPDRILAGRSADIMLDVRGADNQLAVDRLVKMGIITGRERNRYFPAESTQRAEYAVLALKGLNLKDLRDISAIKFVLGRTRTVNINILNGAGRSVATLVKDQVFKPGERTVIWDGRTGTGLAPAGRYTYVCKARDERGDTSELRGVITVVPQTPLEPSGTPTFIDVRPTDWYASYLAVAQKQNLMIGYPGGMFQPTRPISRVEATAVIVRALGLEDLARSRKNESVGFLDYQNIPAWANGYVNVASTIAKTRGGKLIVGYPSNFFLPMKELRRDEAALIVQRLIDKETNRRVTVSGQSAPGAIVTINNHTVEPDDQGQFSFVIEQNTAEPATVAVLGPGMR